MVLVTWHDSVFTFDDAEPPEDCLMQTLGWIVTQGPRFLTIAGEKTPDGDWRAVTHVQLSSIETVENLKVG